MNESLVVSLLRIKNEILDYQHKLKTLDNLKKIIIDNIKWDNEEIINVKKGLSLFEYRQQALS